MSIKVINDKKLYSMTGIVNKFLNTESKGEVLKFITALLRCNVITKTTVIYGERKHYVYSPSEWFADKYEGHYYTETRKYKKEVINGTLYFDEFIAKALSRLYRYYDLYSVEKLVNVMFDRVVLDTALEYIPKIKQVEKELKVKNEQKQITVDELISQQKDIEKMREKMTEGITHVKKSVKKKEKQPNK